MSLGRWDDAVEMLTRAAGLRPDLLPVRINLAVALNLSGKTAEAEALYKEILAANPGNPDARTNLAYILDGQKRHEEAHLHARIAVDLAPGNTAAINVLGSALYGLGRMEESAAVTMRSLAIDPGQVEATISLSNALRARKCFVEAEQAARRAVELDPSCAAANDTLGLALVDLDRHDEAIACFERVLQLHPGSGAVVQHIAMALFRKGLIEEALVHGQRAVELDPSPDIRRMLGLDQIRTGRFREGWKNNEARDGATNLSVRFGKPKWDGAPLEGRTLLVYTEGGIGDAIQFARYLPLVVERAKGTVVFECLLGGVELLGDIPGIARIVTQGSIATPSVPFDCYISLMSLPALFGTTEETIPPAIVPLRVQEKERLAWRRRLAGLAGLKVGLCWAGGPLYPDDRYRSMALERLAPLADVEGLSLISLQLGPPADEIDSGRHGLSILHLPDELSPITKTAALTSEIDLVISVDTVIAHLAGALGVETWLLLPFAGHWIWNVYRPDDTPWYPTHRLFRQPHLKDWDSVVARVREELVVRIADRGANPNRDE
jgi:tetratricopeptide (TPR) repeat protein